MIKASTKGIAVFTACQIIALLYGYSAIKAQMKSESLPINVH